MRFDLDKAMGIHEQALYVRAKRGGVIASNLANADTPNYKARDIDFKSVLRSAADSDSDVRMTTTHAGHIGAGRQGLAGGEELLFRQPHQASIDGNTVDSQIEKAEFTQNAVQYQTTLQFLGGRIKGLMKAIKGE